MRDLEFLLFDVLSVQELCRRERFDEHSEEGFREFLKSAFKVSENYFLPYRSISDSDEPRFDAGRVIVRPEIRKALDALVEIGVLCATQDTKDGGLQLPSCVGQAAMSLFFSSNVATATYAFLTIAGANVILAHGTEEQRRLFARPMLEGRFLGTMDLTEPNAGSSLGDIRTSAVPTGNGTYLLTGTKIYISAGDHDISENIVHLVLARLPDAPPGAKGISLFIVPKFLMNPDGSIGRRNDVGVSGLIHKMGWRGIPSTIVNYGDNGNCVGYLMGPPHQGLRCMFHMMNEARQIIGLTGAMLGYAGYLEALDYARNRPQGRKPGNKEPETPQVPIIEHADVKRMLLAQKSYVEGGLAMCLYGARVADDARTADSETEREIATSLLGLLTPIIKAWSSEYGLLANQHAIQVLGGYGYSREYPVEQLYRDNRLNPIHEGTDGIQALDLLGRKVLSDDGRVLGLFLTRIRETIADAQASRNPDLQQLAHGLAALVNQVEGVTAVLREEYGTGAIERVLAHAFGYLDALGHMVVGWLWLRQAIAALDREATAEGEADETRFCKGKVQTAKYFVTHELPIASARLGIISGLDTIFVDTDPAWF